MRARRLTDVHVRMHTNMLSLQLLVACRPFFLPKEIEIFDKNLCYSRFFLKHYLNAGKTVLHSDNVPCP